MAVCFVLWSCMCLCLCWGTGRAPSQGCVWLCSHRQLVVPVPLLCPHRVLGNKGYAAHILSSGCCLLRSLFDFSVGKFRMELRRDAVASVASALLPAGVSPGRAVLWFLTPPALENSVRAQTGPLWFCHSRHHRGVFCGRRMTALCCQKSVPWKLLSCSQWEPAGLH